MIPNRKKKHNLMNKFSFLLLFLFIFSIPVDALKNESFFLENNTGLDFMTGYYKIEVIEISKPGDMPFVKVNLITGGLTKLYYLRENEDPSINTEPFNKINLNSSFITTTVAKISVEYPDNWGSPIKYNIEIPVVAEKIPEIVLTKSVDKTTLNKGDVVEFKLILENTGNGTAYNLTLEDRFPPGFTSAPGSRFPPLVQGELKAGERLELLFALKAVEPGSYNIEPTIVKYSSKSAQSNPVSLTVLEDKKEKSSLVTVITLDKVNIFAGEPIKAIVKITNKGNVSAESILIKGTVPKGMEVIEGDLRQAYTKIEPDESEEYSATLKAVESGNYSIQLKTSYSDDMTGSSANSDTIIVTGKEKNYLYILIPVIMIIVGIVLFIMKRHREYRF
ncbi:Large cysteine-rich periplasmic protein OmcB [Methanosarcinales archaeon]|nr:Large cysteine-rich periplasmic protein OmcB [Methanosarcinales archaeon]